MTKKLSSKRDNILNDERSTIEVISNIKPAFTPPDDVEDDVFTRDELHSILKRWGGVIAQKDYS